MSFKSLPIAVSVFALLTSPVVAAERSFPVGGFDRILASGSEDVTITTGKVVSVTAIGPQERLDRLDIKVEGKTLKISRKPGRNMSWGKDDTVRIAVTMPVLHAVHASGSGDIVADNGTGPAFEGSLSGSGDLKIARITSPEVMFRTSGSGNVTASGQCTNAKIAISGSGDMALAGLACTNIDIMISGSGDVTARATGNANIKISGSGDVTITGGARCMSRASGSGDVTCS